MAKVKVTFKRHPKPTGLSAVGSSNPWVDIKIKKKRFGSIRPRSWSQPYFKVMIMVMKTDSLQSDQTNSDWMNITFKPNFETEEEARTWIENNIEAIMNKYTLRFSED